MGEAKHGYDHQGQTVKIRLDPAADQILLNIAFGVITLVQATHIRLAGRIAPASRKRSKRAFLYTLL